MFRLLLPTALLLGALFPLPRGPAAADDDQAALPPPVRRIIRPGRALDGAAARPKPIVRGASARAQQQILSVGATRQAPDTPTGPAASRSASPNSDRLHPDSMPRELAPPLRRDASQHLPTPETPEAAPQSGPARRATDDTGEAVEGPELGMPTALRLLTSRDFHARMKASRSLVALGAPALDALGRMSAQTIPGPGGLPVSATRGALTALAESLSVDELRAALRSRHRSVRRAVAAELGRRKEATVLGELTACLDDSCPCVRAAAVGALRATTSRWFGYDAEAHPRRRARAKAQWIAYLRR